MSIYASLLLNTAAGVTAAVERKSDTTALVLRASRTISLYMTHDGGLITSANVPTFHIVANNAALLAIRDAIDAHLDAEAESAIADAEAALLAPKCVKCEEPDVPVRDDTRLCKLCQSRSDRIIARTGGES